MTALDSMMIASPDEYTLTDDYKTFVESMVGYLRQQSSSNTVVIPPEVGFLFRFDMTRFLLSKNVPIEDHYLVMRVNGITSSHELDETITSLIVPDQALITRLKNIYRTRLTT